MAVLFLESEEVVLHNHNDVSTGFYSNTIDVVNDLIIHLNITKVFIWSWSIWDVFSLSDNERYLFNELTKRIQKNKNIEVTVIGINDVCKLLATGGKYPRTMSYEDAITWFTKETLLLEFIRLLNKNKNGEYYFIDDQTNDEIYKTPNFTLTCINIYTFCDYLDKFNGRSQNHSQNFIKQLEANNSLVNFTY